MTCTTPEAATPEPPPVVLTGTLSILVARSGRPWLSLAVRCPACRRPHHHTWGLGPDGPPAEPTHRTAHCVRPGGRPQRGATPGYHVFPDATPENARVLAEYAGLIRRWEAGRTAVDKTQV
jgi:hypothetical protein